MNDLYKKQEIILRDRSRLTMTGVNDVVNFDESGILISSCNGEISVDGEELRIVNLSSGSGEIEIEGRIGGVFYFDEHLERKKHRLFGGRA